VSVTAPKEEEIANCVPMGEVSFDLTARYLSDASLAQFVVFCSLD